MNFINDNIIYKTVLETDNDYAYAVVLAKDIVKDELKIQGEVNFPNQSYIVKRCANEWYVEGYAHLKSFDNIIKKEWIATFTMDLTYSTKEYSVTFSN